MAADSFCDDLDRAAAEHPGRKGERTRARLLARTAALLETRGYRKLTQADICDAAGIGVATFYQYFDNKSDICRNVMQRFIRYMEARISALAAQKTASRGKAIALYSSLYHTNLYYLRFVEANVGLFKCFLHFGGETDFMAELWQDFNDRLYARAGKRVVRTFPDLDLTETVIRTHLMGGMFDEFTRNLLVRGGDGLITLCDKQFDTDEGLASFLTDVWYATVTQRKPPANRPGQPA
jgi:AcrR family transcriptional regulator